MAESKSQLNAGWARGEIVPPSRYPMSGYLARKKVSQASLDPLYIRALVLQQKSNRICILVADLLLVSPAWARRLRKLVAQAIAIRASHVIIAATHTHSGPLVDTGAFHLSHGELDERARKFMSELEKIFIQTAVAARETMQTVQASYSRTPIHGLATDRNQPKKNRIQQFMRLRLEGVDGSAVFGVLPCHPTVLGADNLGHSGDLHGEIARRYERRFDVALIANGACANISSRFTRRSQTRAQVSRFASLAMKQADKSPFHSITSDALSIVSRSARLPVKDFGRGEFREDANLPGRLADLASEGKLVASELSRAPEFRRKNISVRVTLMRIGPILFAALPFELYAETGRFLWDKARITALCYANGYWGYVYIPKASETDYEVISSPFAAGGDKLLRETVVNLAGKI